MTPPAYLLLPMCRRQNACPIVLVEGPMGGSTALYHPGDWESRAGSAVAPARERCDCRSARPAPCGQRDDLSEPRKALSRFGLRDDSGVRHRQPSWCSCYPGGALKLLAGRGRLFRVAPGKPWTSTGVSSYYRPCIRRTGQVAVRR